MHTSETNVPREETRIMVVDCDYEASRQCANQLREIGYHASAKAADHLNLATTLLQERPHVVVLDTVALTQAPLTVVQYAKDLPFHPMFIFTTDQQDANLAWHLALCGSACLLDKPFSFDELHRCICDMVQKREAVRIATLFGYITQEIRRLYVPSHLVGYSYLQTAILNMVLDPTLKHSITKRLYPLVAGGHASSTIRIERGIRHAIEVTWYNGDMQVLNPYFNREVGQRLQKQPANSEFIIRIAENIRLKYWEMWK